MIVALSVGHWSSQDERRQEKWRIAEKRDMGLVAVNKGSVLMLLQRKSLLSAAQEMFLCLICAVLSS